MEPYWISLPEMAESSNAEVDLDSSRTFSTSTQDDSNNVNSDDTFSESKELQLLSVKSIMTILLCLELISSLVCQNAVIPMNFAASVI